MKKAFTLIELLIVVAIIAILAAIAVPNFLEAQVRSKVSRAKADLRSVATAIESYAVDYNHYPLSRQAEKLTTPVAYITALPLDPFMPIAKGDAALSSFVAQYGSYGDIPYFYIYSGPNSFDPDRENENGWIAEIFGIRWSLSCLGPDQSFVDNINRTEPLSALANRDENPPYDTTNGTRSRGNVERFGPGNVSDTTFRMVYMDQVPDVD